jgi:two-component system NtrC family response regulator
MNASEPVILLVDDDPSVTASLGLLLKQHGHRSRAAASAAEALAAARAEPPALVLQDMNFSRSTSGGEGLELLATLRRERPEVPVILITAWGSIELAVEGMKLGAADFITKPWSNQQLVRAVETALSLAASHRQEAAPASREELDRRYDLGGLVGADPKFVRLLELAGRVAPTDASVLILGESGTGKELIAAAIHKNSRRRGKSFVKVNLGGISATLFESEMFGHVRGAFTDARADRKGRFETAHGGTIFLDEIGEVDPSAQVKLLRVLQDSSYEALGSSQARTVDVRVVSATNRDLGEMIASGAFREDLLYRLNLITLRLPPLRERPGDVRLLANHFLAGCARNYARPGLALTPSALAWLERQPFPGNVRQLKQAIERAVLVRGGESTQAIDAGDLAALADLETRDESAPPPGAVPLPGSMTLDQMERAMIANCLGHYGGNLTRVAEALGLSRPALYRRLEKYGFEPRS